MQIESEPLRFASVDGHLFESNVGAGYCFVPDHCLAPSALGVVTVDECLYVSEGWAKVNARLNPALGFHRLFPCADALVEDLQLPSVRQFLRSLAL